MMEHYANHPAIIGYQVDNETTARGTNNHDFLLDSEAILKRSLIMIWIL